MGQLLVDSIFTRDFPVIQGLTLVFGVLVVSLNLLADLAYAAIDPRVRLGMMATPAAAASNAQLAGCDGARASRPPLVERHALDVGVAIVGDRAARRDSSRP